MGAVLIQPGKPLVVRFVDLCAALEPLHQRDKAWLDALHDIWKMGAPSPDSRILVARHYDERLRQPGNVEKRIVFPTPLARWVEQVSAARGMPVSHKQALGILSGEADYGLEAQR